MSKDQLLQDKVLVAALDFLPGWTKDGNGLVKNFKFQNFREAMSAMLSISYEAEAINHHPEWSNVYNKLSIRLSTHDAGGITEKDIELAKRIENVLG